RQEPLDPRRRNHVAAGILDEVALAIGDLEVAVAVQLADIAGMEPAIADGPAGRFRIAPVAFHDIGATHQYLAVGGDAELDPVERRPDRIDLDPVGRIATDHRPGLGL